MHLFYTILSKKKFFSALVITVSIVDLGVSHPQEVVYFAFWLLIR